MFLTVLGIIIVACGFENPYQKSISVVEIEDFRYLGEIQLTSPAESLHLSDEWTYHGTYRSVLACDMERFYISKMGLCCAEGISAFSWDGEVVWAVDDTMIVDKMESSTAKGLSIYGNALLACYWNYIVFVNSETGERVNCLPAESSTGITAQMFIPTESHVVQNRFVFVWPSFFNKLDRTVMSVTDEDLNCIWELSIRGEPGRYHLVRKVPDEPSETTLREFSTLPYLPGINVACDEYYIYLNMDWCDEIIVMDTQGNLKYILRGTHEALQERELATQPGNVRLPMPLVSQMHFIDDDLLAILYGPAAFPSDSAEIWCLDLENREYSVFPIASATTCFAVTEKSYVISTCTYLQDSISGYWEADGDIVFGGWDLPFIHNSSMTGI